MASAAEQQQTTLEFYQAMADFKNMFPQMDDDVIEAVLRSNQGAVDTTIDQLLAMSTDNENEKIRSEIEQSEDSSEDNQAKIEPCKSLKSIHKWQPPLLGPLPDTFLRLPRQWSENCEAPESGIALEGSTMEDERIAIFLQNEEFMAELRWNEDFLSTLASDTKLDECEKSAGTVNHDDEDLFKERLRNMGKVSRRKFAQLTKVFTRSKKRGGRQLLPPTPSCDDLLESEEISRSRN
ncbi:CUE domain-containing protein 1 [Diprion similis]|uniref:CUE domain-containing protein 1 n=1 Tax=Diprion similis TaxID=362088 RepID=UPI001EF93016|nr:CUE domain-containing protein 1 [Diprion similis]